MNRDQGSAGGSKKERKPYTITKTRESWTEQEHEKFLEALQLFDRDWKKIEAFVGTKTVIQIRSHAQKYFLKVQKNGTGEHVPPPRPKRKCSQPYPSKATAAASGTGGGGAGTSSAGGASAASMAGVTPGLSGSGLPGAGLPQVGSGPGRSAATGGASGAPGASPSSRAAAMGALMGSGGVGGLQGTPGVSLPAGMAYHGGFGLSSGMMGAMGPAGMMGAGGMMGGAGMIGPAGGQLSAAGLMGMNSLMGPTGVLSTSGSLAGLPGSEGDLGALSASGLPPLSAIGIARTGSGPAGGVAGRQAGVDGPSHTGPGSAAKSQVAGRGTPGTGEGNENGLRALGGSSGDVSNSGLGGATGLPEDSNAQMGGREEGEGVVGSEDLNGRRESSGAVAMDSEDGEGLRDAGADSMKAEMSGAFGLGPESLAALHPSLGHFDERSQIGDGGELFGDAAGAPLEYQAQLKKFQQQRQGQGQAGLDSTGLEGDDALLLQQQEMMMMQEGELMLSAGLGVKGNLGGGPGVPRVKVEPHQMAEQVTDMAEQIEAQVGSGVGPQGFPLRAPKTEGGDSLMLIDGGLNSGLVPAFGISPLGGSQYSMLDPASAASQDIEGTQGLGQRLREGQDGAGSFSEMMMDAAVDSTGLRSRASARGGARGSSGGEREESSASMGPDGPGARLGSAGAMDLGAAGDGWVHHAYTPRLSVSEDSKSNQFDAASGKACRGMGDKDGGHAMKSGGGEGHSMLRATPDFAAVYRFIGAVFDPNCSDHLTSLRKMAPIDRETVLLLMRNLSINLSSPDFEEHKLFFTAYDGSSGGASSAGIVPRSGLGRVEGNLLLPAHAGSVLPEAEKI